MAVNTLSLGSAMLGLMCLVHLLANAELLGTNRAFEIVDHANASA